MKLKRLLIGAVLATTGSTTALAAETYPVGVSSYNLFEFPAAIQEAIIPDGIELKDDARYVNGSRGVLLKFDNSDDSLPESFEMVVMLKDGSTHMLQVIPEDDLTGQKHRIGDFSGRVNRQGLSHQSNPNAAFLKVMSEKLADLNHTPKGFVDGHGKPEKRLFKGRNAEGVPVGIALQPIERLEGTVDGAKVLMDLYKLHVSDSTDPLSLDPSQFSGPGIGAITITRDGEGKPYVLMVRKAG